MDGERPLSRSEEPMICGGHAPGLCDPWLTLSSWCSSSVSWKDFVEELECELEPLGTQTAGPANISLTVTNMPAGKHFRVDGTSMLQGFSFVVRPPCLVCAPGQLGNMGRDGLGV